MAVEIDDSLYNRQRYVLGEDAMQKMAHAKIFLSGLGGLGIEIAKNLVLVGIHTIHIHDTKASSVTDLGSQFFIRPADVAASRNRAQASHSRLSELNPYVKVQFSSTPLDKNSSLEFLREYNCVIMTETTLLMQLEVNNFCRSHTPAIPFISADVYGVFCWSFCDFGDNFEVCDTDGEEPKDILIGHITTDDIATVTCLDQRLHGFETGDVVVFSEVQGMDGLNGVQRPVEVLTPQTFAIGSTTGFGNYTGGGVCRKVKCPKMLNFDSLSVQVLDPALTFSDLSTMEIPFAIHLGLLALHQFWYRTGRLPKPWDETDSAEMVLYAQEINEEKASTRFPVILELLTKLSYTASGYFPPLAAYLGGVVAQEVLKATTGKFTPIQQWFHLDCCKLTPDVEVMKCSVLPRISKYYNLHMCLGEEVVENLADLKLFLIGCGAIGCESLKNYALLGIGSRHGLIVVTDDDIIEKSNLNRQFLFRPEHIQQSKSEVAAAAVEAINSEVRVEPCRLKVCPKTEHFFNDTFFARQNVIVTALDNVEGRRYVDSLCIKYSLPLLESGTSGTKGHVQVVIPRATETYSEQSDPQDEQIPYCTLKSFPSVVDHTIQWARDKFENMFCIKPTAFKTFWETYHDSEALLKQLEDQQNVDGVFLVVKLLKKCPKTFGECIELARMLFEKYYNHKAKQLLHSFPPDTKLTDGSLFWQSPKKPPKPIIFDIDNDLHIQFIKATARLLAEVYNLEDRKLFTEPQKVSEEVIVGILNVTEVPDFVPQNKTIVTDEAASKPASVDGNPEDDLAGCAEQIRSSGYVANNFVMVPLKFEKDDDTNGHVDFITSASNLRAIMYSIEPADRIQTKKIAGKIIPAIATTTAAVAGLATIELVKHVKGIKWDDHRNCFLNLALPMFILSEPSPAKCTQLSETYSFTVWDRWEITGNDTYLLQNFLDELKAKSSLDVLSVIEGTRIIFLPGVQSVKKVEAKMQELVKPGQKTYTDLVVGFSNGKDELLGPPVRYHLSPWFT